VYSKEEIDKMSFIVKDLNKRQFEGTVNSIKEELISSPVYKLFVDTESEYLYNYVYNIIHSCTMDSDYLKLEPWN
ncbi:MAG: hypothetical protein RBT15_09780, partial [Gudongella sp.]|nr:hypothetical protein [Gudongella sp.]